ncbi:unnamed protein product [Pedinophyceae sp. YPF-701]|nr:unnamed protein product [Pedinophyceae sp. YPF-701]
MGQVISGGLTQYDVEDIQAYCDGFFSQSEILSLYARFKKLDMKSKGYLSKDEIEKIPEVSINPLSQRLVNLFAGVNFKEYARLLSAFSAKASRQAKIAFMFQVYDVDRDGWVGREDLVIMLEMMTGSHMSKDEVNAVAEKVLRDAGATEKGLDVAAYGRAMGPNGALGLVVTVPGAHADE